MWINATSLYADRNESSIITNYWTFYSQIIFSERKDLNGTSDVFIRDKPARKIYGEEQGISWVAKQKKPDGCMFQ